jgi:hypothetical protein
MRIGIGLPNTVGGYLAAFEQAGADEVICFPTSADPEQVDLLADAALGQKSGAA